MSDPTNPNDSWQQVPDTPANPNVPPPQAGYPPPPQYPPNPHPSALPPAEGLSPTAAAAISYLTFIPAVIFLIIDPYKRDPFVRFHSIQSIALNVVGFAIGIIFAVLLVPMYAMGMGLILHLLHSLVMLAMFIAWLMAIIKASQGNWFKLPVIGDFSLNQAKK